MNGERERESENLQATTWSVNEDKEENMPPDGKQANRRLQPLEAKAFAIISDIVFLSKYDNEASFDWLLLL
jgi:hypothetical protein